MKRNTTSGNVSTEGKSARKRLAGAIVEIVTNKMTPTELYDPVSDFLTTAAEDVLSEMRKDPIFVERVLENTTAQRQ